MLCYIDIVAKQGKEYKGELMTTENCKDSKYVVFVCIIGVLLVLGSAIVELNFFDIAYLAFIVICLIRYLLINSKE